MANPDPLQVAQLWHEVLMYSSTPEEVARYPELMGRSPLEMRLLLMAGAAPHLLLRDYLAALHVPKSTLTSALNRLEGPGYLRRVISPQARRSFQLALGERGQAFLRSYLNYQRGMGERILGSCTLVTTSSVARSEFLYFLARVRQFSQSRFFIATVVAAVVLSIVYVLLKAHWREKHIRSRMNRR